MKNNTSNSIEFADKLYQLISGNLSEKEETELLNQIQQNPQLKKWFNEFRKQESLEKKYGDYQTIDLNKKWIEYSSRLKRTSREKRMFTLRVAAGILLLVSLSAVVYLSQFRHVAEEQIAQETIFEPGTQRAILRVADEMEYDLSTVQNIETEGILNNDGKLLSYQAATTDELKKIRYRLHTVSTPRGGEYQLTLEDGTKVWLNADTEIQYQVPFSETIREVLVKKGEIYFEVSKNAKPFIVSSSKARVRVLGTAFNFRAYEDEGMISTTLVEGQVEFISISNENYHVYKLEPGYMAQVSKTSNTVSIGEVNIQQVIAWKEGWFYFENISIGKIMHELSRWYNFNYNFKDQAVAKKQFTMKVKRFEELETILDIIRRTKSIDFETKEDMITVK